MSQVFSKSPAHSAEQQSFTAGKSYKKLFFAFSSFFTIVLAFIFLIWPVPHPSIPDIWISQSQIYPFNLTRPSLLNSSIQLTFVSLNFNKRAGIYYDELRAYASYKGQKITVEASIPPFYQGNEGSNLLMPFFEGGALPVAVPPSLGHQVELDQSAGRVVLSFQLIGKLRWKAGIWVSGRYRFNVNCVSVMTFRPNSALPFFPEIRRTHCSTDV
ncbi:NDR1/HIN1-like 26 [Hibiscus trionum]|uniref:NDR1/HIN1-like 26 n=1 Tax=Hibiscus trionum TaxID=183268 RepID=A0A9W7MVF8_HIBTR|nr:NDR1/HIN1-like 26 [Hibiscus trionum]